MNLFLFMTVSASLLIISALLLRPLTDRILHRRIQMALWMAAALRLLLPFRIVSPVSFLSFFRLSGQVSSSGEAPHVPFYAEIPVKLPETAITETPPVEISVINTGTVPSAQEILFLIWLAGVVLAAMGMLFLHGYSLYRCRNKTRDRAAQKLAECGTVYRCQKADTPFVYGLLRPRIILPVSVTGDDLTAVLAHETAHIKGFDILKKYIFAAALCVNWFNPLVWLMMYFSARDMEILCDARALRSPGAPNKKIYAHALLNTAERRTAFNLSFTSHTEVRIMKILKKEKSNRFMTVLSGLLVALLVTACATVPAAKEGTKPETAETSAVETLEESETSAEEKNEPDTDKKGTTDFDAEGNAEDMAKSFFVQNSILGFGGIQAGMSWEEAKPFIAELSGVADPTLTVPEVGELSWVDFPYTLFEYEGEARVEFFGGKIQRVCYAIPLESEAAAEYAEYVITTKLQKLLGEPDGSDDWLKSWSGTKGGGIVVYSTPIGDGNGHFEEPYSVQLQVLRYEETYVDESETEDALAEGTVTEEEFADQPQAEHYEPVQNVEVETEN